MVNKLKNEHKHIKNFSKIVLEEKVRYFFCKAFAMVVFAVYLNTRGFLFLVINMSTSDFSVTCIADISRHAM